MSFMKTCYKCKTRYDWATQQDDCPHHFLFSCTCGSKMPAWRDTHKEGCPLYVPRKQEKK